MNGTCQLCDNFGTLRNSHVVPRFVYKWVKESSTTGYLRLGSEPNKRIQDGFKFRWLCHNCETMLNTWETRFANEVFHNFGSTTNKVNYNDWLLKFCTSISWRTLNYFLKVDSLNHFPKHLTEASLKAQSNWKEFLLGKTEHPGKYEQHILPLDFIKHHNIMNMPHNINRYIMRTIDIDAVSGDNSAFVYSKLQRFIVIGFIEMDSRHNWQGTKVRLKRGTLKTTDYHLPRSFIEYLLGKSHRCADIGSKISQQQLDIIKTSQSKDTERVIRSESFKATLEDISLSGKNALLTDI